MLREGWQSCKFFYLLQQEKQMYHHIYYVICILPFAMERKSNFYGFFSSFFLNDGNKNKIVI